MSKHAAEQCDLKGLTPESWLCVDCSINTAPGFPTRIEMERVYNGAALRLEKPTISVQFNEHCEVYIVRNSVWKAAGMEPWGGCLCIPCLEQRLGRILKPERLSSSSIQQFARDRTTDRAAGRMTTPHPEGSHRRSWYVPVARYESTKRWLKRHGFRVFTR